MDVDALVFNGIDASSGKYLFPPVSPEDISKAALGIAKDPVHLKELRQWHHRVTESTFGPKEGVDPKNLWETGWGVIFAHNADPAVKEALRPLLERRQRQAGRAQEHRYREFTGDRGYRPGESKQQFLGRQGAGPGPANPDVVPYYLLIVGDPKAISYSFQYQMDVQYAVGRLHFDRVEDYANYARSVVDAESGGVQLPRRASFFATRHPGDRATELSSAELAAPLVNQLAAETVGRWDVDGVLGEGATKERLDALLGGGDTPGLLFTATHGVGFPKGHPQQLRHQGGFLCQDWPGHRAWTDALSDKLHYYSADDVRLDAGVLGLVSFHFACFGAGTPQFDDFAHNGTRRELAPHPIVAALPQQLLGHPGGAASAVVGHVDRAWGYSFLWPQAGRQTEVYRSCLARLLDGHPVGSAFEYLNERYAELAADLSVELEDVEFGAEPDHVQLAAMWTAHNDARGFVILGDPAVRLLGGFDDVEPVPEAGPEVWKEVTPQDPPTPLTTKTTPDPRPPQPQPSGPPPDLAEVDYGLRDSLREMRERLGGALRSVTESLGGALQRAIEDATELEVATYVAEDLSSVTFDRTTKRFEGATLAALTRLSIDGDTAVLVPDQAAGINEELWKLHVAMLEQARSAQQELLRTAASTVAGLLSALKIL